MIKSPQFPLNYGKHILFEENTIEATGEQNQFAIMLSAHHSTIRFNHIFPHPLSDYWTAISIAKGKMKSKRQIIMLLKGTVLMVITLLILSGYMKEQMERI